MNSGRSIPTRLIGNWITYDTTVKEIADFVEQHLHAARLQGLQGRPKFVRDDKAQKAFSKLRSSRRGCMLALRIPPTCPPEYRQKTAASTGALIQGSGFRLQAGVCVLPLQPGSGLPLRQLLLSSGRVDDALLVAQTCSKLDPNNGQVVNWQVKSRASKRKAPLPTTSRSRGLQQLEKEMTDNPTNFQAGFQCCRHVSANAATRPGGAGARPGAYQRTCG